MYNKINLKKNVDGTYDLFLCYTSKFDTEFGLEFLSSERLRNNTHNILSYIKKNSKKIKINAIKVIVNGVVIATMSYSAFMNVYGADIPKYSMAYLYTGTPTQQISYIDRTNGALSTVSPSYFDINADGSLKVNTISNELINHAHSQGMKVIPFLSNHWNRDAGILALSNAENLSTQLANYISQYNLDGINVDIENVTELQRTQYTDFVTKLRAKIPAEKEVSVAVAANPNNWQVGWHGSYDYTNLANNSDYLMIMAYDEHWQGSVPGPVASISFVENSVKYALSKTTGDKIVIGLPFFGRVWNDTNSFNGNGITLDRVQEMITTYNATITYDTTQKSPKATFIVRSTDPVTTLNGKTLTPGTYTIWYENEASIEAKILLVSKYNLKGVGAWSLGKEPSSIWQNYSTWLNQTSTTPIVTDPNYPITGIVNASVLNVRSSPSTTSTILTTFAKDIPITILSTSNGWHTIRLADGRLGYVSAAYVTIVAPTPVTVPEPTPEPTPEPSPEPTPQPTPQPTTILGTVSAPVLNVRSSPSTNSKILTTLAKGLPVRIYDTSNGWHTVKLANGQTAYVSADFINTNSTPSLTTPVPTPAEQTTNTILGTVNTPVINVRSGPSTNSPILTTLAKGLPVRIYNTSNGWHTVKLANGQTAYISSNLINTTTPTTPSAPIITPTADNTRLGIVNIPVLNVRSSPSLNSRILTTLAKGLPVRIYATSNGWHTVKLANGQTAYVSSAYISENTPVTTSSRTGIVNTAVLNVRSLPTTNSTVLKLLRRGEIVNILSTSNGWHTIKLANGQIAYVSSSLIRL